MIEVYRIPVPKDRLLALPKDERILLLQLGYVANQVLMFEKLLTFALQRDGEGVVEQFALGVQAQMLLRLGVGAVFEALLVVERRFLSNAIGRDYSGRLDAKGQEALAALKKFLGNNSLLAAIRNNFGFHYPGSEDTEAAFQTAVADPGFDAMWEVYFSHHGFNSLFLFSDAIFSHGIAASVGAKDLPELQERLVSEFRDAGLSLVAFSQAFFAAIWVKHFGEWIDAKEIVQIAHAPKLGDIVIPFFVEVEVEALEEK